MSDTNTAAAPAPDDMPEGVMFEEGESVVVDLQGIAEAKFENVPKGKYDFEVQTVEWKRSSKGFWMFEIWSAITTAGDFQGRKMPYYLSFSPKALPFTKAAINKLAWPELLGKFDGPALAASGALLNKTFRAQVGQQEYEGTMRSNISQILPAVGTAAKPASSAFA